MKQFFFSLLLSCLSLPALAQLFPVESQLVVRPPSSVYLSDFTELGSERLSFMLNFTDNNEPEYDVRLHLRLEGAGVVLETSPNFNPAPLTLRPDGMRSLELMEWAEYLDPNNLVIVGLDQGQFRASGGKLPEGMYQLCLTVRDYRRPDVSLSRENCTILNLRKNNPPQAFVPTCGSVVQPIPNNQVQLNWQANHDAQVNAQYTIDLVKVEPGQDPNQAIISGSQRLLPDVEVNNRTSYTIDPADPMSAELIYGETYAYRINVTDLDGLTTFENDGIGEVCWFTYGFLPGGLLAINYPQENGRVNPRQPLTFRWNGPTNAAAGTRIYYKVRVADITDLPEGADTEAALLNPNLLIDEQTSVTGNLSSWNFTYDGELETERNLVWKVEAYVDGAENEDAPLAQSEVVSFRTTPLLDRFRAGQYTVLVNTAGNSTLDDFSGTGTVLINDTLNLDVAFEHLVIEQLSTANVLLEGVIDHPLDEEWPLENPDGGSFFLANRLLLDRNTLEVEGLVRHTFGLRATSSAGGNGPFVYIQSPVLLLSFEAGILSEGSGDFEEVDIMPSDLPGVKIEYRNSSYTIEDGTITYNLNGFYRIEAPLAYMGQEEVSFAIENKQSFYDQTIIVAGQGQVIQLTETDKINLLVKELVVDLRYDESSPESEQDDQWVGFYVKAGELVIPTDFDENEAILPLEEVRYSLSELETPVNFSPRLNLDLDYDFPESDRPRASFYSFLDDWHTIQLTVEDGSVTQGGLMGVVYVPFLNDETPFDYSVSISDDGTEAAWLSSIDGYVVEFMGKDNLADEISITVLSGSFSGTDRLVLNTGVYFAAFDASFADMSGLTLWGDGSIGFDGVKHGLKNASDHIAINVNNFPGNLKSFGISYQLTTESVDETQAAPEGFQVWDRRIRYLFAYEADVNFGMFLSSVVPGNAPKTAFSLAVYRDLSVLESEDYESNVQAVATTMPDEWTDLWEAQGEQDEEDPAFLEITGEQNFAQLPFLLASVATSAIPGVANVSVGDLRVIPNDPDWGTLFALQAEIEMLRPFAFTIQINVFAGHTPWVNNPDGYAYTAVKLGLKDGTEGSSQSLDNHLNVAKTRHAVLGTTSDSFNQAESASSNPGDSNEDITWGRTQIGPLTMHYLALGVYINMDYDASGNLIPSQDHYGGLVSYKGSIKVPPSSEDGVGEGINGTQVGKRKIAMSFTAEVIVSPSLGFSYVYGSLGVSYTEGVSSVDASNGGNYIKLGLEGSFDWEAQLFRSNASFDLWYPPICMVASGSVDFQLNPDTKDVRMLNIRMGSYANRLTMEYCQAVEAGSGDGGSASVGYSLGFVGWLDVLMKYGLPSAALPFGVTSYASIDEDLANLDDQMAALAALPPSERAIIEQALTDPSGLPEGITSDPDFQQTLQSFEETYGTKVLSGEIGVGITASIEARANDWIDLAVIRFIPFVTAESTIVGWGNMQILPAFALNEIGVELTGNAQIGAYYEELDGFSYSGNVKTWTALSITLNANGTYNVREERIYGSLSAQIQFIALPSGGYLVDVTADVPYDFSTAAN